MTKGLMILIFIGVVGIYFVTNLVEKLQEDDATYQTSVYKNKKADRVYYHTDSSGRIILDVSTLDRQKQYQVWSRSDLKQELVDMIPSFEEMEQFASQRVHGSPLREEVLDSIRKIKRGLLSGSMTQIEAQKLLDLPQQ